MLNLRILTVAIVLPLYVAAMFLLPNTWRSIALIVPLLVAGHEWARLAGFGHNSEIAFLTTLLAGCVLLWAIAGLGTARAGIAAGVADRVVYALSTAFWCAVAPCWLWLRLTVRRPIAVAAAGLMVLL